MKNFMIIAGVGLGLYGLYLLSKKAESGCEKEVTGPKLPLPAAPSGMSKELMPDVMLERFDYSWNRLYPTPQWMGIKYPTVDEINIDSGQTYVANQ